MPVALSYYGNIGIEAGMNEADYEDFSFTHRMNYFHQLIVSRKFSDRLSMQLAPSFAHFNGVDREWYNDYFGISAGGRFKAFGEFSIIAQYTQGFGTTMLDGLFNKETADVVQNQPKPNVLLGFEIGTPTHSFQLFAANYDKITPQKNLGFNTIDGCEVAIEHHPSTSDQVYFCFNSFGRKQMSFGGLFLPSHLSTPLVRKVVRFLFSKE